MVRTVNVELGSATIRGGEVGECVALLWLESAAAKEESDVVVEGSARRCGSLLQAGSTSTATPRWRLPANATIAQSSQARARERVQKRQQEQLAWAISAQTPLILCIELNCATHALGWTRVPLPRRGVALRGRCTLKLSADDHTRKHATSLSLRLDVDCGVRRVLSSSAGDGELEDRRFGDVLRTMAASRFSNRGSRTSSTSSSFRGANPLYPRQGHGGGLTSARGSSVGRAQRGGSSSDSDCPELFNRLYADSRVREKKRAAERAATHNRQCTFSPNIGSGKKKAQRSPPQKVASSTPVVERLLAAGASLAKKKVELADERLAQLRGASDHPVKITAGALSEQVCVCVCVRCPSLTC